MIGLTPSAASDVLEPSLNRVGDRGPALPRRALHVDHGRKIAGHQRAHVVEQQVRLGDRILVGLEVLVHAGMHSGRARVVPSSR